MITVCDKCLTASCWKGIFLCDEAYGAGTTEKTAEELQALGREHPDYWDGTYEKRRQPQTKE